ncbi:hypothetical protein DFH08DRAFT_963984 [Mycena albidolilacea]|uniref:Uncharacterized protein n=1 Tax=Mycena albidolilacea TaxID=1033008 RepID=A0AAD6ZUW7_9AGAR|nr:hypothetical protein DFH08DRAFT_963984 [Mycena albidolilacea]
MAPLSGTYPLDGGVIQAGILSAMEVDQMTLDLGGMGIQGAEAAAGVEAEEMEAVEAAEAENQLLWEMTLPDTLACHFADLLQCDPPAHDGWTYRSPINPEDPTVPRRVQQGNQAGCLQRDLAAMCAESEARMAAAAEEGAPSVESMNRESPTPSEMESIEIQNPFLSALPVAASSGVLHLMGQDKASSSSTQVQDFNEKMDNPPWHWTTDKDNDSSMGPTM